jgi:hypothetical protein
MVLTRCCLVDHCCWSQDGTTEKIVADLEQTWLKSQQTNNPDLIIRHLAIGEAELTRFEQLGSDGLFSGDPRVLGPPRLASGGRAALQGRVR